MIENDAVEKTLQNKVKTVILEPETIKKNDYNDYCNKIIVFFDLID